MGGSATVAQHSLAVLAIGALALVSGAKAAVVISSRPTQNMIFSGGVCVPTARDAVLNVGDLESLLARGNATVTTIGGGVQADDIKLDAALSWSSDAMLTLDAHRVLAIDNAIFVGGAAGLSLASGRKPGALVLGPNGNVSFANLSSTLMINGVTYTLVDAHVTAEIGAVFGLGALVGNSQGNPVSITNAHSIDGVLYGAEGEYGGATTGGLVGVVENDGQITGSSTSGSVTDQGPEDSVGGLVGVFSSGTIALSHSSARVSAPFAAGGLIGSGGGAIDQSYATGKVSYSSSQDLDQEFGGLVGGCDCTIVDSYSTGAVSGSGGGYAFYGGLVGVNGNGENVGQAIATSYSTGKVKPASGALRGGFVGNDTVPGDIADAYWDLDRSGVKRKSQGAGTPKMIRGLLAFRHNNCNLVCRQGSTRKSGERILASTMACPIFSPIPHLECNEY